MPGYFNNKKETDNIIKVHKDGEKWIHTGDLGIVNQEGFLIFRGRIKKIYLTKGNDNSVYKLFPLQIENELKKLNEVLECGTIVILDVEKIHVAISYVRVKSDINNKEIIKKLYTYAKDYLPAHAVPREIIIIEQMPHTQSNKINYQKLKEKYREKNETL